MQSLQCGIFEPELPIPNLGLQLHRATKVVWFIYSVWFGQFNLDGCIVELAFVVREAGQCVVIPKQDTTPVKTGGDSEGRLVMTNCLLFLPSIRISRQEHDEVYRE